MQGDDPPYLPVGTAVSAKYKGAFCEAKVSKVVRCVKCKITFKMGLGQATVTDEMIRGPLRVGHTVQARHSEKKEFIEATISKIQDCSQYTVVFDDGDITTLRRTALCLKSGRHFNESETLDQLPLTHPEHFGNPVVGGRRGRRSRQLKEDSSEGEPEEENEPDLVLYSSDIGKVVCVEGNEKKKSRDNWFPGLVVVPSAQPTVRINVREEYLVRSFKDGRYYTVPKKEISEFTRDLGNRIESTILSEAMDKAIKYLDRDELPVHWERATLFDLHIPDSDSDENCSDSSDDEPREEKDHFVAQLYKFMDDRGTPLNKSPMISNRDVDLYRLFRVVHKMGGFNRVTNQSKWRSVTIRLGYQHNHATYNSVKQFYKKYLFSFEEFYRKLGCTMINHPRNAKKHRGRNLIRDRDRATPVNSSPRPERSDESVSESSDKKEDKEKEKSTAVETPTKAKAVISKKEQKKEKEGIELSDSSNEGTSTSSSSTFTECTQTVVFQNISAATENTSKKKTTVAAAEVAVPPMAAVISSAATTLALPPAKAVKERKVKAAAGDKVKALVEHFEEQNKKEGAKENSKEEEEEKTMTQQSPPQQQQQQQPTVQVQQQTRSKSQSGPKVKEKEVTAVSTVVEKKEVVVVVAAAGLRSKVPKKPEEDKQRRGRKRKDTETEASKESGSVAATSTSATSAEPVLPPATSTTATTITSSSTTPQQQAVNIGDKLKVYYGPTHESKVTYEAKVLDINRNASGIIYRVHYTGWNTRYDEWIKPARIAENLSTATKAKRLKQQAQTGKLTPTKAAAAKRGRGTSISSRAQEPPPRSTTPSSVTSSSSRTKSPATPASNKAPRVTRGSDTTTRRTRRTSAILSDSDSDSEEQSESEISRTRSGGKSTKLTAKRKDEDNNKDSEKEDEEKPTKRPPTSKRKKEEPPPSPLVETDDELGDEDEEEEGDDDENNSSPPKGRDFDLNQIRSELKGFEKAVKISTSSEAASESSTPDEDTTTSPPPLSAAKDIELKKTETETTKSEKSEKSVADKIEKSTEKLSKMQNEKSDDIYEFKEPEPFEFEARATTKLGEEKGAKKRLVSRLFDDLETSKSPPKKKGGKSPSPKAADEEKKPRTFGKRTPGKAAAAKLLQQQQQQQEEEEEGDEKANVKEETTPVKATEKQCDDPFDKLVESPSFNLIAAAAADKKASPSCSDATSKPKVVKALNMDESAREFAPPLQTPATVVKKEEDEDEEKKKKDGSRKAIKFCNDNEEALFIGKEPLLFTDAKPDPIPSSSIKISEHPIFGGFNAGKSSPDTATEADDVKKKKKRKKKDGASDEDDLIKAAIQRAISNTMTDEDSAEDDLFMAQSAQSAQMFPSTKINTIQGFKVKEELLLTEDLKEPLSINTTDTSSPLPLLAKESSKDSKESKEVKAKQISPALQETDSSLLEAISLQTEMLKKEEPREPQIKTGGTKIADSILQKFNMIKKNEKEDEVVMKLPPSLASECTVAIKIEKEEEKEKKIKAESAEALNTVSIKVEEQAAPHIVPTTPDFHLETNKKRSNKKVVSREFIEESESDSTDSEERLIIARSDDDSQTNPSSDKLDFKDTDNSNSMQTGANTTDDSQEEAPMTTATPVKAPGDAEPLEMASVATGESEENAPLAAVKSSEPEESESNISLLLCKETIPGSPAPVTEMSPAPVEPRAKPKSAKSLLLEMPFASAPGTSNSKGMLSSGSGVQEMGPTSKQPAAISVAANVNTSSSSSNKQEPQPPLAVPLEQQQIEEAPMVATINNAIERGETNINNNNNNNSGGPTTPESTISNLSPNTDRVSPPNTVDNETCKSTDSGRNLKRYCQEMEEEEEEENDALLDTEPPAVPPTIAALKELVTGAAPCRKRRRSCKGDEIPVKRGRKPNVRNLRSNSDSDDTSEHSAPGSTPPASSSLSSSAPHLSSISSRPSKFNFIIELDSSMDSAQRISLLTQKLSELRKTYNTVKTELACIDRRRKKLRRREREALKASKQELACS